MEVKNDDPNPNPKPLGFREKEMKTCRGFSYFSSARYAKSQNPICLGFSNSTKISVHEEPVLSQPAKLTESETSKDIPISLGISDSTKISVHEEPVLSQLATLTESKTSKEISISLGISVSTKISIHEEPVPSQPVKLTKSEISKDIDMLTSFKFACLGDARYGGPPDDSGRVDLSLGCSLLAILMKQRPHPEPKTEEHKHGTNPQPQRYNKPGPTTEESYLYRFKRNLSIMASGVYGNSSIVASGVCKALKDSKKEMDSILDHYRRPPK